MPSAKRTPRYVERIPPPNIQIVGSAAPAREAQVIPIRRVTPAYVPVIPDPLPAPAPAPEKPRPSTRRRVPSARRPWRVLLVPPTPGAQTRAFGVARWQARLVLAALALLLLLSGLAVGALVLALQSPDLFTASADAALLRSQMSDMEDSLATVRADLASSEASRDSALAALLSAAKSAEPSSARKPLIGRAVPRPKPANGISLAPRSLEGLPVIGRVASGFSHSRRHPILHIRRPHLGVDLAAPRGTQVSAPADGRVTFVGHRFGYGLVVELAHTEGIVTRYAHLREAFVAEGEKVTRGARLASVGSSGLSTGPHLHYEILVHGRQVDPLRFRLPQSTAPVAAIAATPSAAGADPASTIPAMHESGLQLHQAPAP